MTRFIKRAACILAGALLIFAGPCGVLAASGGTFTRHGFFYYFIKSMFLTGPFLIGAGGWLWSLKKTAWKSALFAYGILLIYLIVMNIAGYIIALRISYPPGNPPNLFSLKNLVNYLGTGVGLPFQIPLFLAAFFLGTLVVSRKEFK